MIWCHILTREGEDLPVSYAREEQLQDAAENNPRVIFFYPDRSNVNKEREVTYIEAKIAEMEKKFAETMADISNTRGVVPDVFRSVLPIMQEQLDIMKMLLALIKE